MRNFIMIGLAVGLDLGAFTARGDLEVSATVSIRAAADFYAPLAPNGTWIEVGTYGRCWRPAGVTPEWRPYCYGHWVWTDCGWYWASDEPWGWACYHYGCWVYDPDYAWVWVPGIEWAPAWVSWRVGGGYIGWAPLPPRGVVLTGPSFVFVNQAHFDGPVRPSTVIVNNTAIINKTTVINNIKRETRTVGSSGPQKVVINQGPGLAAVQSASGKTIKTIPIRVAARQARAPAGLSRGTGEWKSKDKPGFAPAELPKSALERKPPPGLAKPEGADLGSLGRKDAGKRHEQEGEHHGRD